MKIRVGEGGISKQVSGDRDIDGVRDGITQQFPRLCIPVSCTTSSSWRSLCLSWVIFIYPLKTAVSIL